MASLTRGQLLAQAGLAAGNDQTTTFARTWMDAWCKRTAKSWAWPVLKMKVNNINIASGADRVGFGLGYGGTDLDIHRIFAPIMFHSADYKTRGRMLITQLLDMDPDTDETTTQASARLGTPETCKIQKTVTDPADPDALGGQHIIYPNPVPNQALILSFWAHVIPGNLPAGVAGDDYFYWYPNDRTLLQAMKCALLEMDDGGEGTPAFDKEMLKLGSMVVDDRDFDGEAPGDNVVMGLDSSVFR